MRDTRSQSVLHGHVHAYVVLGLQVFLVEIRIHGSNQSYIVVFILYSSQFGRLLRGDWRYKVPASSTWACSCPCSSQVGVFLRVNLNYIGTLRDTCPYI